MDFQTDNDFGSGGAAVLADLPAGSTVTHTLICGGKDGGLLVLNRDLLGGFGDAVAVQKINFGHAIFATGAFWNNNFYLSGVSGPLTEYQWATSIPQFKQYPRLQAECGSVQTAAAAHVSIKKSNCPRSFVRQRRYIRQVSSEFILYVVPGAWSRRRTEL